ncbi:hypothetical protein B0H11DRAFT_2378680 [Mycena galericulata]|nr:hypothetical protein B0H11DRAFT_2378680 [Mycena galericulata]
MDATDPTGEQKSSGENTTRVDELWFPEGGLVLQAEDRIFRVASSILAARSSVFRDMLSIPQTESQALIEECPIVAIFDSSFFERPPVPTTFSIIAGVLKLSTKYDVQYLRHRALLHIAALSPMSLEEHDTIAATTAKFGIKSSNASRLLLAHSLGLTWAMPAAMYIVACAPVEQLHRRFSHHLRARQNTTPFLVTTAMSDCAHGPHDFAAPRDLPMPPHQAPARLTLLDAFTRIDTLNPVGFMHPRVWSDAVQVALLCSVCVDAGKAEYAVSRQKVWGTLPRIFNLPSWEELKSAKDADLKES